MLDVYEDDEEVEIGAGADIKLRTTLRKWRTEAEVILDSEICNLYSTERNELRSQGLKF